MFVVQATLITIVNYDPNTFIVQATVNKLYFDLLNILNQKDFIRSV